MPSPKAGTVSADPAASVAEFKEQRPTCTPRPASRVLVGFQHSFPRVGTVRPYACSTRAPADVSPPFSLRACLPAHSRNPVAID